MSCHAIRHWLHREPESLDEAERLVLEDHLAGCEHCRSDREQLLQLRHVGSMLPAQSIGPRGHQRAIARALMQGPARAPAPRHTTPWWAFVAGGALAAVIALLAIFVPRSDGAASAPPPPTRAAPSEHLSSPPERVVQHVDVPPQVVQPDVALIGGTLVHGDGALAVDGSVPANVTLRASSEVTLRAYSIGVVVAASSEIRHSTLDRSIILERGRLELDGRGSRTVTDRFTVEGEGVVTVTPKRVSVKRGHARVIGTDGKVLAIVASGHSWELSDARAAMAASTLLEQARAAFTSRDYATAERHADAALDASPSRGQAAEARTILAECALATGRLDDALDRYEAIAARFADLPAGETALFAAARLEANRNHRDVARQLLQRYLDRYPSGRFAADARRQLRAP